MTDEPNPRATLGGNNPPLGEALQDRSAELISQIEPLAKRANALPRKIETDDHVEQVAPVVMEAKRLSKLIENMRVEEKAPFLESGKTVDGFFKPHIERLNTISNVFQRLTSDFQRQKEADLRRKAEEAQRKAEEEARKQRQAADEAKRASTKAKRLDAAQEADNAAERAAAAAEAAAEESKKLTTSAATVSGTKFWNFRVDDFAEVDLNAIRDFFPPDAIEKAIRAKVKIQKGGTKIKGVTVFEDVRSTFR